jgi:hypothetical protein
MIPWPSGLETWYACGLLIFGEAEVSEEAVAP